jgi:hypothetical protein
MNRRRIGTRCGLQCGPLVALAITLAACSDHLEAQVSGRVTLDGKPIGPGTVVFAPFDASSSPAIGAIQPDGEYFLKTSRTLGLAAGKYRGAVSVYEQPADAQRGVRQPIESSKLATPQKYLDAATSGLEFDVQPGSNVIDIELKSQ